MKASSKIIISVGPNNGITLEKYQNAIRIKNMANKQQYTLALHKTKNIGFELDLKEKEKIKDFLRQVKRTNEWKKWWDEDPHGYISALKAIKWMNV